jgi:hypothetical protein
VVSLFAVAERGGTSCFQKIRQTAVLQDARQAAGKTLVLLDMDKLSEI